MRSVSSDQIVSVHLITLSSVVTRFLLFCTSIVIYFLFVNCFGLWINTIVEIVPSLSHLEGVELSLVDVFCTLITFSDLRKGDSSLYFVPTGESTDTKLNHDLQNRSRYSVLVLYIRISNLSFLSLTGINLFCINRNFFFWVSKLFLVRILIPLLKSLQHPMFYLYVFVILKIYSCYLYICGFIFGVLVSVNELYFVHVLKVRL